MGSQKDQMKPHMLTPSFSNPILAKSWELLISTALESALIKWKDSFFIFKKLKNVLGPVLLYTG